MSNTVITNYTDLNGPSTKADSSVVVIVNKDGSLSVDQNLLGTLMGTDGSQSSGISVVRVGHEGRPDDATDSENEDDKIPHVTLTVDSYYNEPNSIIKYDSGAEMLQSLRIETRENSLVGFHNDHCYTSLTSPTQVVSLPRRERSENFASYNEPVIQITHTPPPKPVPNSKKITILEQQIIPKGKKIQIKPTDSPVIIKGKDVLSKPLPVLMKANELHETDKIADSLKRLEESAESSSMSSSGDSIADRDSDSDYKDQKVTLLKPRKAKVKPRILKGAQSLKANRLDNKSTPKLKLLKSVRREVKEIRTPQKVVEKKQEQEVDLESLLPSSKISVSTPSNIEFNKTVVKQTPKPVKKEKKTPAHVTALLSDMTSLFSTPDVIRRVSTDNKPPSKAEKEPPTEPPSTPKLILVRNPEVSEGKPIDNTRMIEVNKGKVSRMIVPVKKDNALLSPGDKTKGCDLIPQIDDASLAQILQDTESIPTSPLKAHPIVANAMNSPGLAGPMSPTLDLGLQPTVLDEDLSEDLLLHVAHLVQNSDKLQEVIDTQVLNVETPAKHPIQSPFQQAFSQTLVKSAQKAVQPKEKPIQIVKSDGRVITLPPIEAPATRSSKRKSQMEITPTTTTTIEVVQPSISFSPPQPEPATPERQMPSVSKQYNNKKLLHKKQELQPIEGPILDKSSAESQESWNSEDDPFRLWCICKQPHNNRFMICCDGCEDWFHGKCVNITKAMGQQMEDQGIEWRCPNCIKKTKSTPKSANKTLPAQKLESPDSQMGLLKSPLPKENLSRTHCIVCKKSARASSIYCSDTCILKHAQDSLGIQGAPTKPEEAGKSQEKLKSDSSRVIVYERKSGRLLAGPNAPTAGELKSWLQKNPTFEVVRPGALSSIRPGKKKLERKVQTTLNFERVPKTPEQSSSPVRIPQSDVRDRRLLLSRRENTTPSPKQPPPRSNQIQLIDTPRPSTSAAKPVSEPRKLARTTLNRSMTNEKPSSASPSTSRRKDSTASENKPKMNSTEPIRDNVRKSLQEQMSIRMKETKGAKFTEDEVQQFAVDTEVELHDLFKDVGMKYKAKYRSLMFNIKDRKNLSLWEKIFNKSITPQQLVRLTPEEMASQELSEWRDQESKYQLELIKKSELDLLAASKTYVLKTHKGEEVMETKESVSTELDPNVPVEDLVTALNDSTVGEEVTREVVGEIAKPKPEEKEKKESKTKKRERDASSSRSKKSRRNSSPAERRRSRRDSDRKSRSSRRKSEYREKESRSERRSTRRTEKKSRTRSISRDRTKRDSKEKSDSERSKHRSRSREKAKRSKSREQSRSASNGRERSRSRGRATRRSGSKDAGARRHRSRSKHASGDDNSKLRSRSQDNSYSKNKTDSTDSDSIERPKSASLKEPHPEYDPHEPMITSAFSEEDLRKTEDAFEDTYKSEILDSGIEYDPTKMFTLDSSVLPSTTFEKQDKAAEAESDQEPSSTVENAAAVIWNGCINMVDVARFYVSAHEVSGSAMDLEEELCAELDIVGRINPETVWDYIHKTKKGTNKDVDLLRLQAANDEEKMQYIALYSYLSSRNRLGVVKVPNSNTIKDFYIIPVPANTSLPPVLLPLNGPGLGDARTHLLVAVIVRQRRKRSAPNIPKDIVPAKVVRESRKRSYTPPVVSKSSYTPPTSPKRRALPLPTYPASSLSTSVKDKIAASLACAEDGDEAYSPGGSSSSSNSAPAPVPAVIAPPAPPTANVLRTKMEELNRQIEEQKQQIMKMAQADSSVAAEDEEAYSPSRPMTPPLPSPPTASTLAGIALPSNLQEILANIKQRSENQSTDVDMRNLPLP